MIASTLEMLPDPGRHALTRINLSSSPAMVAVAAIRVRRQLVIAR